MLLYHGSNADVVKPVLIKQLRGLDFGAGFYLTSKEQQATDFARIVVKRRQSGFPIVSVYEYDENSAASELEILRFKEADLGWLEFVRDNRFKVYSGKLFDVIIGPVANDRVYPTIQAFMIGQFSAEAALLELKTRKLYDQYCFASERALSMLQLVETIAVERDLHG